MADWNGLSGDNPQWKGFFDGSWNGFAEGPLSDAESSFAKHLVGSSVSDPAPNVARAYIRKWQKNQGKAGASGFRKSYSAPPQSNSSYSSSSSSSYWSSGSYEDDFWQNWEKTRAEWEARHRAWQEEDRRYQEEARQRRESYARENAEREARSQQQRAEREARWAEEDAARNARRSTGKARQAEEAASGFKRGEQAGDETYHAARAARAAQQTGSFLDTLTFGLTAVNVALLFAYVYIKTHKRAHKNAHSKRRDKKAEIEGLSDKGEAAKLRHKMTDFGSPWRGFEFSKAVDAEGTPKRVYHGTGGTFENFDVEKTKDTNNLFGYGNYFTEDASVATEYADGSGYRGRGTTEFTSPEFASSGEAYFYRQSLPEFQRLENSERRSLRAEHKIEAIRDIERTKLEHLDIASAKEKLLSRVPQDVRSSLDSKITPEWIQDLALHPEMSLYGDPTRKPVLDVLGSRLGKAQKRLDAAGKRSLNAYSERMAAERNFGEVVKGSNGNWAYQKVVTSPNLRAAYVNIEKPFVLDAAADAPVREYLRRQAVKGYSPIFDRKKRKRALDDVDSLKTNEDLYLSLHVHARSKNGANDLLQSEFGYDGVTHIGGNRMGNGHEHRVWIAFRNDQVQNAFTHAKQELPPKALDLVKLENEVPNDIRAGFRAFAKDSMAANFVVTDALKKAHAPVIEGLKHGGMAEKLRHLLTSFGSGWRGLVGVPKDPTTDTGFLSFLKPMTFAGRPKGPPKGAIVEGNPTRIPKDAMTAAHTPAIEGLKHGGMAERLRHMLTDFGSGWRGLIRVPEEFLPEENGVTPSSRLSYWMRDRRYRREAERLPEARRSRLLKDLDDAKQYRKETGFMPVFINEDVQGSRLRRVIRHERIHAMDQVEGTLPVVEEARQKAGSLEDSFRYKESSLYRESHGGASIPPEMLESEVADRMHFYKEYAGGKIPEDLARTERLAHRYEADRQFFPRMRAAGLRVPSDVAASHNLSKLMLRTAQGSEVRTGLASRLLHAVRGSHSMSRAI